MVPAPVPLPPVPMITMREYFAISRFDVAASRSSNARSAAALDYAVIQDAASSSRRLRASPLSGT